MRFKKGTYSDEDEKSRLRDNLFVTRRETLIGAFASAVAGAGGTGTVTASGNSNLTVDGVPEGENVRYAQFENGNLSELQIDGDTSFRVEDIPDLNGEEVVAAVDIAVNRNMDTSSWAQQALQNNTELSDMDAEGGVDSGLDIELVHTDWETVRQDRKEVENGFVDFEVSEMYDTGWENGHDHIDFSEISIIHDGEETGDHEYGNLGVAKPKTGEDFYGIPRNKNTFEVRFTITSRDGGLHEEEIVEFTIDVTPKLGFGNAFGTNFGRNHIADWPSDWETA